MRYIYLNKLIRKKKNGLIKVVTGVRRCGKSYLLFRLFHRHLIETGVPKDHIIEVTLDDRSNKELRDPDVMLDFVKDDGKREKKRMLEVDFVATRGSEKYYIQSACSISTSEKTAQKQRSLLNISDSFRKIIVVGNNIKVRCDENGITMIGLRNFLLDEDSLRL